MELEKKLDQAQQPQVAPPPVNLPTPTVQTAPQPVILPPVTPPPPVPENATP
jgi:hypothetical protein